MVPFWAFGLPWALFAIWWLARSFATARVAERESFASRLTHLSLLAAAFFLLFAGVWLGPQLERPLFVPALWLQWLALALTFGGVAFAIWAREHLGRYWSGAITLKEGHRLIRTGPYRLARHPIYTGILLAGVGPGLARGDLRGLLGVGFCALGLWRKIRLEEELLARHFGDEYARYRREVRAIIPFIL